MTPRRTIFVTGGGSGIGRAIAQRFASEGWFIGLGDIDESGLQETGSLLPSGFTYSQILDVRDRAAWDGALKTFAIAAGGRIDVVANAACVAPGGALTELTREEIDRTLEVNLRGAIYGAQAAYPWLRQTAPGSCLLITSGAAALYGMPKLSVDGAAKAGLRSLTETLDGEWAADGINVRCLMPGTGDTSPETVAEAAWQAVHGSRMHWLPGKAARRMRFAARWMPGRLRAEARRLAAAEDAAS